MTLSFLAAALNFSCSCFSVPSKAFLALCTALACACKEPPAYTAALALEISTWYRVHLLLIEPDGVLLCNAFAATGFTASPVYSFCDVGCVGYGMNPPLLIDVGENPSALT